MEFHKIRGPALHSGLRQGAMLASLVISAAVVSAGGVWAGEGNVAGEGEEPAANIWTKYYDRTADREPRPLLLEALERFREEGRAVERAVDAGCGTGVEALFLARMGAEVRAFDSQPEAIRRLKAQAAKAGGLQVLTEVAPFHDADWGEDNDLVFAGYALPFAAPDHFGQAWQKLTASLARGGR
ncbi:MAG: methyltransferase domain-containing protein, partial [Holophagales bacterium]|nr:methyltransferase domain-containing protein [Holophagales bacterium]